MTGTSPAPRRWLSPRFSLRLLLIAVTAFAIGFPVWYRWPYEETQDVSTVIRLPDADPFAPGAPGAQRVRIQRTLVTTWQRQWGGGRLKHGTERLFGNNQLVTERTYRHGELHGPFQSGALGGQYDAGQREGVWAVRDESGKEHRSEVWRNGRLDGKMHFTQNARPKNARRREFQFSMGQLVAIDGQVVNDRLGQLLAAGQIDDPSTVKALLDESDAGFAGAPLGDLADFLMAQHQVPIVVDSLHADRNLPITADWPAMPFASMLAALASEHGLGCDFRFGLIWITSASDAEDWHDPTGVAQVVPPSGSPLAAAWNQPANIKVMDLPLGETLENLASSQGFLLDTSKIDSADGGPQIEPATLVLREHPLRHVLGILLYKSRSRCELNGETLVILPPEESP